MNEDPDATIGGDFAGKYVRGLRSAARNNSSAYAYSVTITEAFGILSTVQITTTVLDIFAFAGAAVLAYAIVDGVASGGFRHRPRDEEPTEVTALGSSVSFVSGGRRCLPRSARRGW